MKDNELRTLPKLIELIKAENEYQIDKWVFKITYRLFGR